jgi:predicted metalloprotease with PDZ domain
MLYRIDLEQAARRRLLVSVEFDPAAFDPAAFDPAAFGLADVGGQGPERGPGGASRPADGPGTCVLAMPVWTPGSYLVREYARHVSRVHATDQSGAPLPVAKVAKNRWAIRTDGTRGAVRASWTVLAHELSVRTSYVTSDFAFWNGACALLWPVGLEARPADFEVRLPESWVLCAGHRPVRIEGDRARFRCADLDEAVDTPCLAGLLEPRSFEFQGREHRFVSVGLAGIEPPAGFDADLRKIVESTAAVVGGPVPYEGYTFLALFAAEGRGGLEHRDSSTLLAPRTTFSPRSAYEDFLALVAHEYLHVWNVKRLRPREFWSLDLERENYTRLLWVAEGFTAYFDDLLVRRAGLSKPTAYLERIASHVRALRANPGRHLQSLGDSSFDAWILLYRPDENTRNLTQNYYTNGALAALVLDSEIRRASGGARSLDHVLRRLWTSTFEQGRGYDLDDVIRCIDEAAGAPLGALVRELAEGPFEPDLERTLGLFGLRLVDEDRDAPFLGVRFRNGDSTIAAVDDESPAFEAGLCPADELLGVRGLRVTGSNWQAVWDQVARPGAAVDLLVARQGVIRTIAVQVGARPTAGPRVASVDAPTESQLAHRESWLGARSL